MNYIKTSIKVIGSFLLVMGTTLPTPQAYASQTCTYEGDKLVCTEDETSSQPSCVGNGPFECSDDIPAGS